MELVTLEESGESLLLLSDFDKMGSELSETSPDLNRACMIILVSGHQNYKKINVFFSIHLVCSIPL